MKRKLSMGVAALLMGIAPRVYAQTVYIPSGTGGIGTSTNSNVGVGTSNAPATKFHVKTNVLNDGIRIEQGGTDNTKGAASLGLYNTLTGGRSYGLLSTSTSNSQLGGKLLIYDYSGGGERMLLDGSGNLGIGVFGSGNPAVRLHIKTSTANDGGRIEQNGSGSAVLGLYNTTTGARNWTMHATGNGSAQGAGNFMIKEETSGNSALFINGSNLNVGLGTTTPVELLHMHNGAIRLTGVTSHGGPMILWGGTPGGAAPTGQWGLEYVTDPSPALCGLNFWRPQNALDASGNAQGMQNFLLFFGNTNNLGIKTNNTSKADLTVNGRVLIGNPGNASLTTPGTYGLYVENGILTTKVRVAALGTVNWADYVFADNYALRSFDDLRTYISVNKHLPDVPSTAEVEKDGVDLLQMNVKLLEKVEELTLYLLQQEQRIKTLEAAQENSPKKD